MPDGPVMFRLPDGTVLTIDGSDMRRVYDALWDLSAVPGAISAAALLLRASRQKGSFRQLAEINASEADALKRVLDRFANPPS